MRIGWFAVVLVVFVVGCSGTQDITIPVQENDGDWVTAAGAQDKMYMRQDDSKYVIRDEPYSIASKKKDPELLGPQRTYNGTSRAKTHTRVKHKATARMTKASCIRMIGEAKYNDYVQKYGGENGALRRCLVLKRIRG